MTAQKFSPPHDLAGDGADAWQQRPTVTTVPEADTSVIRKQASDSPVLFWALVILVVLAPLPIGAVYTWTWSLMALIVAVLLGLWSVRVIRRRQSYTFGLTSLWLPVLLFAGVCLWAFVQGSSIAPSSWHHPLWQSAAKALDMPLAGAISLNPHLTFSAVARILTYAGIFWLALQYGRRVVRARQMIVAVALACGAYALYGLIAFAIDPTTVLGMDKTAYLADLTSTFVNRNSYATYAGIGLICFTALIIISLTRKLASAFSPFARAGRFVSFGARGTGNRRGSIAMPSVQPAASEGADLMEPHESPIHRFLKRLDAWDGVLFAGWLLSFLALISSHSRAGFLATMAGMLALFGVVAMTRTMSRWYRVATAALCILAVGVFFVLAGEKLATRLAQTDAAEEERPRVYQQTLTAIEDAPLLGTGFGTFEEVFRFYQAPDIGGHYASAHSSYLENMLELGLPAAFALLAVLGFLTVWTLRGIRKRRRDAIYPSIGFAVTVLVGVHSLVDFSLHIPAISATYALLMGAACAQCSSSRRGHDPW